MDEWALHRLLYHLAFFYRYSPQGKYAARVLDRLMVLDKTVKWS